MDHQGGRTQGGDDYRGLEMGDRLAGGTGQPGKQAIGETQSVKHERKVA